MNAISPPAAAPQAWLAARLRQPGALAAIPAAEIGALNAALLALPAVAAVQLADETAAAGAPDAARQLLQAWVTLHPAAPGAFALWFNLGALLAQAGRHAEAVTAYRNALSLKPDLHEASVNLGLSLEALGRPDEALATWRSALPEPRLRRTLHNHLGRLAEERADLPGATAELRQSLLLDPDQPDVIQHWAHMRQRMTDWPVLQSDLPGVTTDQLARHVGPLAALALFDDPATQREVAATWIARKVPAAPMHLAPPGGYAHRRIRIGYLSSDFCRHAMSFLMAEVLERHDRAAFEVFGYCNSPDDGSELRARVIRALDHHVPIRALDDETAARRIRADEIDILVDLNGLTRGARLGVLRWRPAPVQATYLGYIGPVPLPELDWLICDNVAVPPELAHHYAPAPLPLAGCYQANDASDAPLPPVSRASEGLPEDRFVFCCFSHHYKLTPEMFAAWLDILAQVPDAVLWLVDDGPVSRRTLTERWTTAGLAPDRLIFAPRVDPARYRARMALGDLFLDTSPYNAGTIASDALRMGLPLLTLGGRAFAARMAASLLTHMNLPECVAPDMPGYVAQAVRFARDPELLAGIRRKVGAEAWRRSIGDSAAFTHRLEAAYRSIRRTP
jgi:predicted O-linked N-acetylglucosamine transferase (SPINDLY family)